MAPLFCQRHVNLIASDLLAVNFAQVQCAKLHYLRDAPAQVEILDRESLEPLILSALAYIGRPVPEHRFCKFRIRPTRPWRRLPNLKDGTTNSSSNVLAISRARRRVYAIEMRCSPKNRRLKIAHAAAEAIRHDLERDRTQLLAAAKEQNSNPLQLPKRH